VIIIVDYKLIPRLFVSVNMTELHACIYVERLFCNIYAQYYVRVSRVVFPMMKIMSFVMSDVDFVGGVCFCESFH